MKKAIATVAQDELDGRGGVILVDVREPGEFAGERLPGSVNAPLSRLEEAAAALPKDKPLVVVCRSGRRAQDGARRLSAMGFREVRVLDGGLQCCSGLERGPGGVWAMERQVRMAAGTLILLGCALGFLVHPGFFALSAAIGAGLVYSAATDTCGMAAVLARLPWNRR
jgi:rhodanese-related sulfurtransferase